jgi:nicotinamide-nucleotide adenylyltransferase
MHCIREIIPQVDRLIIVIGSAQQSHTNNNPFTAGERVTMITRTLIANKVDMSKVNIIPVPDINENSLWVHRIYEYCPDFDVVFTNSPLAKRLFDELGLDVKSISSYVRYSHEGTHIRNEMHYNDGWAQFVPDEVAKFINEIRGIDRMRALTNED